MFTNSYILKFAIARSCILNYRDFPHEIDQFTKARKTLYALYFISGSPINNRAHSRLYGLPAHANAAAHLLVHILMASNATVGNVILSAALTVFGYFVFWIAVLPFMRIEDGEYCRDETCLGSGHRALCISSQRLVR